MTRFARARGSKSSNQRLPHPPTDWSEMKLQLLETKQTMDKRKNVDDEEEKIKRMRVENYEKFLKEEVDNKNNTEWAEFEENDETPYQDSSKQWIVKTETPVLKKSYDNQDDDEAPIEISSKQPIVETVKPLLKKISDDNQNDHDDDDHHEAPLEISSKQPIVEIVKPVLEKISDDIQNDDDAPLEVSSKQPIIETTKHVLETKIDDNGDDDDDDDEGPLEVSSKQPVETVKPVQKKKKIKKTITVKPQEKNKILKIVERENRQITRKKKRQQKQLVKKRMENGQISEENLKETTGEVKKSPKILIKSKLKKQPIVDGKKVIKRKKNKSVEETEIIHGREIVIKYFDGYRIKKDDYERIMQLKRDLKAQKQPKEVIAQAVKRVRRTAEKNLRNEYMKVCFKCRKPGHKFSECPESQSETNSAGVCFRCGSTEHTLYQCKDVKNDQFRYATCFICGDEGHISRQCPQNSKGAYPKGGNCFACGSNEHLKKDCPQFRRQQEQEQKSNDEIVVGLLDKYKNPEIDDFDNDKKLIKIKKVKKINFNK